MIQLVIFDMDGTILDTLEDLKNSLNYALDKHGFPMRTLDEVRAFVGNGIGKLIERGCPDSCDPAVVQAVYETFIPHYAEHCNDQTRPYPGIPEAIAALRRAGYQTAVVSNKADFAVADLCKIWFDGLFDAAQGEREGISRKPAPDSVFAVCDRLHISVDRAVYIGDSEVDVQTARNAGMRYIGVDWGFRTRAFLIEQGAQTIVSTPAELLSCFGISL